MLGISFLEIEQEYAKYVEETSAKKMSLESEIAKVNEEIRRLNKAAYDGLNVVRDNVLGGKYGYGELKSTSNGLQRVIGLISDFNETSHQLGITLNSPDRLTISASQVAQMCEDPHSPPPLFYVDVRLMPISRKEAEKFCFNNF